MCSTGWGASRRQLETPESFYLALADSLADQLDLDVAIREDWGPQRGPNRNFEQFVRRDVLARLGRPLV